ncbi:hypothetical protein BC351_33215 [Paenibacillus ferrarius]|uniref:SEC-C motif-containing protein n=1 Tax=Paenibacillus ferrarius TaxID=1469647 RepID=A0A1V4HE75_9BACL|nr:SEC-C domain-containing protein [Paenibacillus ferrarius]OPH52195.1 hypothetical protein BC351_33215 [Paenibacillus ferrarius]
MKVSRNDPCPCGSGAKYKKCCIPKYDQPIPQKVKALWDFESFAERTWNVEKLEAMSEAEILGKLNELGIRTNRTQFAKQAAGHISADEISEKWISQLSPSIDDFDEDFPLLAAEELWKRWLPDQFSLYHLEDMLEDYLDNDPDERILERFWGIWAALRDHILLPYKCRSLEQFMERFDFPYEMNAVFFDTEPDMIKECWNRQEEYPESWDRLILLYWDMLKHLTDMSKDNKLNVHRSYAEAHFYKGDINTGNALFKQLTDEHPEWAWGYVGWGDMYNPRRSFTSASDKGEALRLYRLGLEKASSDKDILEERIKELMIQ